MVRNGREVFLVQSGGRPRQVDATTLPAGTDVLQLSPDGVRAAVVADSGRSPWAPSCATRTAASRCATCDQSPPTLTQVVDVAWRDSEELLVLAGGAGDDRTSPYLVGVDGWGLDDVTVSGLPETRPRSRPRPPGAARGRPRGDLAAHRRNTGRRSSPGPSRAGGASRSIPL